MKVQDFKIGETYRSHFNQKVKLIDFDFNPQNKPLVCHNPITRTTQFYHYNQLTPIN